MRFYGTKPKKGKRKTKNKMAVAAKVSRPDSDDRQPNQHQSKGDVSMVNSILQQNTTSYNGQFSKQQRFGLRAEQWATHYLAGLGYDARLMSRWTDSFDILVNGLLKVEVKISRPYQRQVRPGYYRPAWLI